MAAQLSHGTLIAVARELLNEVKAGLHVDATNWRDWIAKEEAIRTLWAVYIVDGLQAFAYSRSPWFTLSDLSELPDISSNELWEAQDEGTFANISLLHSPNTPSSVFGFVSALKEHASQSQLLSKGLSLPGNLLALISISTTITSIMHSDASARKSLATRFQSIPWFDQSSEVPDSVEELCQSLFCLDADLRNKIQDLNRLLSRWLDSLQVSSSSSKIETAHGPTPFIKDFMPWYWVCVHLLHMLEDRLGASQGVRGVSSEPNGTELASLFQKIQYDADNGTPDIMRLLVLVRMALNKPDGGASMQSNINKSTFTESLPPLPTSSQIFSVTMLFPLLVGSSSLAI